VGREVVRIMVGGFWVTVIVGWRIRVSTMKFFGLAGSLQLGDGAGGRKCKMARKDGGNAPGSVAFPESCRF